MKQLNEKIMVTSSHIDVGITTVKIPMKWCRCLMSHCTVVRFISNFAVDQNSWPLRSTECMLQAVKMLTRKSLSLSRSSRSRLLMVNSYLRLFTHITSSNCKVHSESLQPNLFLLREMHRFVESLHVCSQVLFAEAKQLPNLIEKKLRNSFLPQFVRCFRHLPNFQGPGQFCIAHVFNDMASIFAAVFATRLL